MKRIVTFKDVIPGLSRIQDDPEAAVDRSLVEHIKGKHKGEDIELQRVWVFSNVRYQKSYPFPVNAIYVVREKPAYPPFRIKKLPRGAKRTWGSPGVYAYKLPPGNMILVGHEKGIEMNRVLIIGGNGMLGRTLHKVLDADGSIDAVKSIDLPDIDITDTRSINKALDAYGPNIVILCAAMTNVDLCETEQDKAFKVNALGAANVAKSWQGHCFKLIYISTDYVFDGNLNRPYNEFDDPVPGTVYGRSKLAGERKVMQYCPNHLILRTAWLYGQGGPSFYHAMSKLASTEGMPVKVVNDQTGNPTSALALSRLILWFLLDGSKLTGIYHATCEGKATWYQFASDIFTQLNSKRALMPCTSLEYQRPAVRPSNSQLDKMMLRLVGAPPMPTWEAALDEFIKLYPDG